QGREIRRRRHPTHAKDDRVACARPALARTPADAQQSASGDRLARICPPPTAHRVQDRGVPSVRKHAGAPRHGGYGALHAGGDRLPVATSSTIVRQHDRAYLVGKPAGREPGRHNRGIPMPETVSAAAPAFSRPLLLVAAAAGILLAGTVALWAHYGTAVFYEMIAAGIAACL